MKLIRILCIIIGAALLSAALLLTVHNIREDKESGMTARNTAQSLYALIPEPTTEPETESVQEYHVMDEPDATEPLPTEPSMAVIELEGTDYIGILSIPELGLELPVRSEWSYPALKETPCRYHGTAAGNNLVIAAHNYQTHFGRLSSLEPDSEILFTDASGWLYCYHVSDIEQLPPAAVDAMRFGDADHWDLTLFTCTLSGQSRVTVRAELDSITVPKRKEYPAA